LLTIGALTLTPAATTSFSASAPWWCVWCGDFGLIDAIANVVLFAPLGIGLWLFGFAPVTAAGMVLATTIGIEALQLSMVTGRDANLRDVLTNAVGAGIGFALAPYLGTLWRPPPRLAGLLAGGTAAAWIVSRILTGVLLAPSPPSGPWFAQIAPRDVYPSNLDGMVTQPTLNARPIGIGRLRRIESFITTWEQGEIAVAAEVTQRSSPERLASAVNVLSGGLGWALLSPFDVRLNKTSGRWSALVVAAAGIFTPELITVAAPTPAVEWLGAVLGLALGFGFAAVAGNAPRESAAAMPR